MIFKLLALVLALAGYYISPYNPLPGPNASEEQVRKTSKQESGSFFLGKVIKVADGDTVTVRDRDGAIHKIRMHGTDAPELKQAGGIQARDWLSDKVFEKDVKVLVNNTDRYKRQVAKVLIPVEGCTQRVCEGEIDINLRSVEEGHAWWYKEYSRSQSPEDRLLYEAAQEEARRNRIGLWKQRSPQAPWEWRTEQRNQR